MKDSIKKHTVIILGKIPPPYYGPAIATEIILNSALKQQYNLKHVDTRLNESTSEFGRVNIRKIKKSFSIYANFIQTIRKKNVDLVLIPISQSTIGLLKDLPFFLVAKLFRSNVIMQLRGSNLLRWYAGTNILTRELFKHVFKKLDGAVVLGENLRYLFHPFLPEDKIYVVPNGSNYNMPEKDESEKIRIFFLSILHRNKAPDILLESLTLLPNRVLKKLSIKVAGEWEDPEYERDCRKIVEEYTLPVEFLEPVSGNKKLRLLKNSDIFVFTPRAPEGHPWVIVEAMAAGLPIISTDQGAITESVLDGENGFIIPNNNPTELAKKIEILATDECLRNEMAKKSHDIYNDKFTEDKMVSNLSEAIAKTIGNNA